MQLLRIDHDQKWKLLPVHELREYERVQLGSLDLRLGRPFELTQEGIDSTKDC
jgi:hypothetical protein